MGSSMDGGNRSQVLRQKNGLCCSIRYPLIIPVTRDFIRYMV